MHRIPRNGPVLYKLKPISGLALAPGATSPALAFRWPDACLVTGVFLAPRENTDAGLAALEVQIQDETNQNMVTDGLTAAFAPAFALHGRARTWFPLRRWVESGESWIFTVRNVDPAATLTPELLVRFEEEHEDDNGFALDLRGGR